MPETTTAMLDERPSPACDGPRLVPGPLRGRVIERRGSPLGVIVSGDRLA
jgi:hypothetical protein